MPRPRVSVVTIFLNAERFLEEAIDSIRAQTHPNWEIVLVDDGSTDGSSAIAQDYAARYPESIHPLGLPLEQPIEPPTVLRAFLETGGHTLPGTCSLTVGRSAVEAVGGEARRPFGAATKIRGSSQRVRRTIEWPSLTSVWIFTGSTPTCTVPSRCGTASTPQVVGGPGISFGRPSPNRPGGGSGNS